LDSPVGCSTGVYCHSQIGCRYPGTGLPTGNEEPKHFCIQTFNLPYWFSAQDSVSYKCTGSSVNTNETITELASPSSTSTATMYHY
jgi:hypothetical protein